MMESPHFYGIDVSQASLDIAEAQSGEFKKIAYTERAVRQWLKTLPEGARLGVESTGSLHRLLVRCAMAAGYVVYVLNARDLSHYARAVGRRAKTDRLDAQLIARYLAKEHEHLHPYRLPTALQQQLDELIRRRHKAVVMRTSLRQSFAGLKLSKCSSVKKALDALIDQIDQRLARLIAQDEQLAPIAVRLKTVVGFGPLLSTAMTHMLLRHPFKNADAFIAYIGYDPRPRDSGKTRGRRYLSKRGLGEIRRLLHTAAMSASKTALWRPVYQRYLDRGLPSTAALVILARKLARIAFAMVKSGEAFDPKRVKIACARP